MAAKQVLVMKKFPKGLRTGKYVAQGAHASVGALLSIGDVNADQTALTIPLTDPFVKEWILGPFAKVTLQVDTDQELVDIYRKALAADLPVSLIKDAGRTEFGGVATLTAVGIGPGSIEAIDAITGDLSLF